MFWLITLLHFAGLVLFAVKFNAARAFIPGLFGFAILLFTQTLDLIYPKDVGLGSPWEILLAMYLVAYYFCIPLHLGAVYGLRDASPTWAAWERRLLYIVSPLCLALVAFHSVFGNKVDLGQFSHPFVPYNILVMSTSLLIIVAYFGRYGMTSLVAWLGIAGFGGFGALATSSIYDLMTLQESVLSLEVR